MSDPTTAPATFLRLLGAHEQMLSLFLEHQVALVGRDLGLALERLLETRSAFEHHASTEEQLFPRLFAEVDQIRGTPIDLFTGEHRHMREMLGGYESAMRRLDGDDPALARRIIELIEDEALFKAFFLHHDERERNLLYPAFDRRTADAGREELLRLFQR